MAHKSRISGVRNNRKMTKGRKANQHIYGGERGYVPNEIIRKRKYLKDERRVLRILKNKSPNEQIKRMDEIAKAHNRIQKLEQELGIQE